MTWHPLQLVNILVIATACHPRGNTPVIAMAPHLLVNIPVTVMELHPLVNNRVTAMAFLRQAALDLTVAAHLPTITPPRAIMALRNNILAASHTACPLVNKSRAPTIFSPRSR